MIRRRDWERLGQGFGRFGTSFRRVWRCLEGEIGSGTDVVSNGFGGAWKIGWGRTDGGGSGLEELSWRRHCAGVESSLILN